MSAISHAESSMEPVNLAEFEALARKAVEPQAFDYISGGANDEITLASNVEAFHQYRLRPRMLIDVSSVNLNTTVLSTPIAFPVMVAPTAFQTLAHPDGELAMARAAHTAGTAMVVSTLASHTLEDVARAAPGPKWFQLYCYRERTVTRELVQRAEASGYSAICLTVDVPRIGQRERDVRNRFSIPPTAFPRNFEHVVDLASVPTEEHHSHLAGYVANLLDGSLTWRDVEWLKSITELPVLVKGILTGEDGQLAVQHGADGVIVSNHGGRQLDRVPATIDVLEEVVQAVQQRADVLLDGGIRRGTDVVIALALGAKAVLLGRPCVWGLGANGEDGARTVLQMLRDEVELAMALCGCTSLSSVTREHVRS